VLWGISWVNLQMMIADAPRLKRVNKRYIEDDEELFDILNKLA